MLVLLDCLEIGPQDWHEHFAQIGVAPKQSRALTVPTLQFRGEVGLRQLVDRRCRVGDMWGTSARHKEMRWAGTTGRAQSTRELVRHERAHAVSKEGKGTIQERLEALGNGTGGDEQISKWSFGVAVFSTREAHPAQLHTGRHEV